MKFFVDTANVADIKKANDLGVICGVTTNPSLIAKEGSHFYRRWTNQWRSESYDNRRRRHDQRRP